MSRILSTVFINGESKIRNIWWVIIFFLILSALLFPLIFLADYYDFEIEIWQQAIIILIVTVVCQLLRRKPQTEWLGKINLNWFKEFFIGLGIGAALMILPALTLTVFGYVHWQLNTFSFFSIIPGIALMASVAFAEELLFRGFIFQRLIDAFGKWPAQLLLGGLFLLTHLNNPGMTGFTSFLASINIFIASLLFGMAYLKTKSLALPIGLHFMANLTQGVILGFGVSGENSTSLFKPIFSNSPNWLTGGMFGLEASIFGLLVLVATTVVFVKWEGPSR
jgi:membrane protease YdiL (CAAX protease family)